MLVDTARTAVSVQDLYQAVNLARFYKVPYVHLHMTDDHAWTFPSTTFPALGSLNIGFRGPEPQVYNASDLRALVAYVNRNHNDHTHMQTHSSIRRVLVQSCTHI